MTMRTQDKPQSKPLSPEPAQPADEIPPLENGDHLTRAELERRYEAMPHVKKAELLEGVVYIPLSRRDCKTTSDDIPPLEHGDQMDSAEFERRYENMPLLKKAELIEGVVYMPSPVRVRRHSKPQAHVICWLATYDSETPCLIVADNSTVRLDLKNRPQPDGLLMIDPACGGKARIDEDDYIVGAPDLDAESLPVQSATTSMKNCAETASVSILFGVFLIGISTGSCCAASVTSNCRQPVRESIKARSSLGCGSTFPP